MQAFRIDRRAADALIFALAAILALAVALSATHAANAAAKTKPQKFQFMQEPVFSTVAPQPSRVPTRFFTINQVLAKADGRNGTDGSDAVRLAALQPDGRTDAPSPSTRSVPTSNEPFGLFTFRAPEGLLWVKWRGVETEIASELRVMERCRAEPDHCASGAAWRMIAFVNDARGRTGKTRIDVVNRAINGAIRYTSDFTQHGVADKWTAPLATLTSGLGDCEDYAIAKYVVLREAGVAVDDLRLVLVRDRIAGQDHAVLAVREGGRWLILDNRNVVLQEATEVPHFVPLFALDHQGVKLFAAPYAARPVHESEFALAPAATADPASATALAPVTPFLL